MQIAMIGQKGYPAHQGGVEKHAQELSRRLVEAGHDVVVYARGWYTKNTGQEKLDGVQVAHLPSIRTKHLDTITHTFLSTIHAMKSDADVIHYHGVGPALLAWLPRLFTPEKRVVVTFHSIDRKHAKWGLLARLALRLGEWASCRFAHTTIAFSPTILQYIRDVYDTGAVYIPTGLNPAERARSSRVLARFSLAPGNYVLCVSRLIPHKGIHTLIAAWQRLRAEQPRVVGATRLVIVGDGHYTDRYVRELKTSVRPKDIILFTGEQTGETLQELLSHARFVVHPSENEGLPISVLEAMNLGLPVLASDIIEHQELIKDARWRFAVGDAADLARLLAACLRLPPPELKKHGDQNRAFIQRHFSWDVILPQILACYGHGEEKQTVFGSSPVFAPDHSIT